MRTFTTLLVASAALALAAPGTAALQSPEAVRECVEANLPENTSFQTVTLTVVDRVGSTTMSNAHIFWRRFGEGSRALLRFSAPPDLRGSSLLLIEKDGRSEIFMYLPELRKVRRVNKRSIAGSMFGTDFTYEDWERLQGLAEDLEEKLLPDAELEGRAVYVVEARPARGADSDYERILTYVDQERCLPVKTELFEKGDRLRKVMTMPLENQTREGRGWVPRVVRVKDLVDETRTELTIVEIEVEKDLPRKLFSETELAKGN